MNKWHVYEYMKQVYMRTGIVPTWQELRVEFSGLRFTEIQEGMSEFQLTVGRFEKGA